MLPTVLSDMADGKRFPAEILPIVKGDAKPADLDSCLKAEGEAVVKRIPTSPMKTKRLVCVSPARGSTILAVLGKAIESTS